MLTHTNIKPRLPRDIVDSKLFDTPSYMYILEITLISLVFAYADQGPVVQSIVSLTSLLRGQPNTLKYTEFFLLKK